MLHCTAETPPYDHLGNTVTSLLRPYIFLLKKPPRYGQFFLAYWWPWLLTIYKKFPENPVGK